ncbi:MAG: efflux RND transporter periplasmic adaptor subunit [Nitrosomonas sp.]|nr:MAG: efflux RND transporter periplasmic adaptor subunit [Nitrosomonas sp.]
MQLRRQLFVALAIAVSGGMAAIAIINSPPQSDRQEEIVRPPAVQYVIAEPERLRMDVRSQGRVTAQTEIDLITGVSGNIISISPAFVSGGAFGKGDLLVSIDPAEYDLRVAQAQARVMEAQYQLTREEAEAEQAREEWQQLGQGDPSPLSLRIPQLQEKKAKLAAEQEELKNARLLRQRTEIRAPFNGRVRNKAVGMGQYLSSGDVLGRIYNSDLAEIRLPVSTQELAWIEVPASSVSRVPAAAGAQVKLTAHYQGEAQYWQGRIVRSEGVVDEKTGMVIVVAQIADPFGLRGGRSDSGAAVLPIGLHVEAGIEGQWLDHLFVIPAGALLKENRVAVIDQDQRLRLRSVAVLRKEREHIILREGLATGDRVLVSGLHHPVEGMTVTPEPRL